VVNDCYIRQITYRQNQEPTPKHDPNVGEIICGAILALAGGVTFCLGGWLVGAGEIAGGVALIVDGEKQLNSDELICQLYWLSVYFYNGLDALHKLTVLAGVQHPYPADLGAMSPDQLSFGGQQVNFSTTGEMCKSLSLRNMLVPCNCTLLD